MSVLYSLSISTLAFIDGITMDNDTSDCFVPSEKECTSKSDVAADSELKVSELNNY